MADWFGGGEAKQGKKQSGSGRRVNPAPSVNSSTVKSQDGSADQPQEPGDAPQSEEESSGQGTPAAATGSVTTSAGVTDRDEDDDEESAGPRKPTGVGASVFDPY